MKKMYFSFLGSCHCKALKNLTGREPHEVMTGQRLYDISTSDWAILFFAVPNHDNLVYIVEWHEDSVWNFHWYLARRDSFDYNADSVRYTKELKEALS